MAPYLCSQSCALSERTATKKESDSLAAQKALAHLEGLLNVKDLKLTGKNGASSGDLMQQHYCSDSAVVICSQSSFLTLECLHFGCLAYGEC